MKKIIERIQSITKKAGKAAERILMGAVLTIGATTPCFAGIVDAGQNFGTWVQEQGFYIALAVIVIALIKFMLKKAWIPAGAFLVVGGILLYIIGAPDSLKTVGQSLFNMLTQ